MLRRTTYMMVISCMDRRRISHFLRLGTSSLLGPVTNIVVMSRTFTFTIFLIVFSQVSIVSALARAPFPDATRLQPIPIHVAPNISGNVNSSLHAGEVLPQVQDITIDNDAANAPSNSSDQDNSAVNSTLSSPNPLAWLGFAALCFVLIIMVAAFLTGRRRKFSDTYNRS